MESGEEVVLIAAEVESSDGTKVMRGQVGFVYGHRGELDLVEFATAATGPVYVEIDPALLQRAGRMSRRAKAR